MRSERRHWLLASSSLAFTAWIGGTRTTFAAPGPVSVDLELVTAPDVPPTASQQWLSVLRDLPVDNMRIRTARDGDRPEITKPSPKHVVVIGIITAKGTIVVPGSSFSQAEIGRFKTWLTKLKSSGGETPNLTPPKTFALGLTADQLIELHEGLNVPVNFSTKGLRSKDVVRKIRSSVRTTIEIPAPAVAAFADDPEVLDELQGVAAGTAIAAAIRPLGLVLIPDASSSTVKLVMAKSSAGGHIWPVGWPPEKNPTEYLPALLKFLDVEIADTPLNEALEAVQGRLKTPFLYDHNGMARQKIDPSKVVVSVPKGKTFYGKILDRMTMQAKLKWEVRVDEAGQAIVWISPRL